MSLPTHPACQFVCQKETKIGERCANGCELAPFASMSFDQPPKPRVSTRVSELLTGQTELQQHQQAQVEWGVKNGYYQAFDAQTGQCNLCNQLPGVCVCTKPRVIASGQATLGAPPPPPPLAPVVIIEPAKRINVRAKGQRGERQVIGLLQAVIDQIRTRYHAEPLVLQRNALQAHLGGCDLHGLDGFAVEVKHVEVEAISQWWKQTVRQAEQLATHGVPHTPVLFYRASHKPWRVKFRAYVQTPRDRDLIELDIETELADFLEWFENAYDEVMSEWAQKLS